MPVLTKAIYQHIDMNETKASLSIRRNVEWNSPEIVSTNQKGKQSSAIVSIGRADAIANFI
jgi:hypothetical protein